MSRTVGGRVSWLEASWCPDEAEGAQTAQPGTLCRESEGHISGCFLAQLSGALQRAYNRDHSSQSFQQSNATGPIENSTCSLKKHLLLALTRFCSRRHLQTFDEVNSGRRDLNYKVPN